MKTKAGMMRQNNVTKDVIDFIRENALVREIDSKPTVMTRVGGARYGPYLMRIKTTNMAPIRVPLS